MNFFRKPNAARPAVFGLFLLLASPAAFAVDVFGAIDVFGIVDQIKNQEISIFLIGGACLLVVVVISSFQWLQETIADKKKNKKQLEREKRQERARFARYMERARISQHMKLDRLNRELNHASTSAQRKLAIRADIHRIKHGF